MRRCAAILAATMVALLASSGSASTEGRASPAGTAVLGLSGIGPVRLGMTRAAALQTGWLAGRGRGCPLGGPPVPITYHFTGPRAPRGLDGTAEFDGGHLRLISFARGVRTSAGIVVGRSTAAQMVSRYRRSGFTATSRFVATFSGTFITVTHRGRQLVGGFAKRGPVTLLGIPSVPVCE